ncbi:MAG TPA: hypothetical protein VIG72_02670, partial [Pontibacter sp.]
ANSDESTTASLSEGLSGKYEGSKYNTAADYHKLIGQANALEAKNLFNDNVDLITGLAGLQNLLATGFRSFLDDSGEFAVRRAVGAAAKGSLELSGGGRRILGNLQNLKDLTLRNGIILRGGKQGNVNKVADWLHDMPIAQVANLASKGDKEAVTAIKILKQASSKAQKY